MERANRLREVRKERGMSQTQLVVKGQLSPATVAKIECWEYYPTAETRAKIAATLGVSEAEIWPEQPE